MNSKERFSATVDNYIKYRPGYPQALLTFFKEELRLSQGHTIADLGSGTGKLTELLLESGSKVVAVEPNEPMRHAAEQLCGHQSNFQSVNGTAEDTTLLDNSVDFITCAQAFHWFDVKACRKEFGRILKSEGKILLIWNKRRDHRSAFMQGYNDFLDQFSTDYQETCLRRMDTNALQAFFNYQQKDFLYEQVFDFTGLKGRYLSCSYAFQKEHTRYEEAQDALALLFKTHEINGTVKMEYCTEVYYGR